MTLRVFIGVDRRQPVAFTVCASSVLRHAKSRVCVEPTRIDWVPGFKRQGLTEFTFLRYLVPWMCNFEGVSVFLDGDIVVLGDINDLVASADPLAPVSVAKHVARFEWPSVMVFQNKLCKVLTPAFVNDPHTAPHLLEWSNPIGTLPAEWNHAILWEKHREDAKLLHFTCGLPAWPETKKSPHADKWGDEWKYANSQCSWEDLMGKSVHVDKIKELNS